jgi:hypothetical protein
MFSLGNRLAVRLPRRSIAAKLLENEQHWLPQLAKQIGFTSAQLKSFILLNPSL